MIYEDILRELAYMRIYLGKNIGKVSRKEIYKLYRRYLKLYVLLPIKNPEFDKNNPLYFNGNCYCYALMLPTPKEFYDAYMNACDDVDLPLSFHHDVGFISEKECSLKPSKLLDNLKIDLDSLGIYYYETDIDSINNHGGYKISLYYNDGEDFHFIRDDFDGKWSHKMGYSGSIERVEPSERIFKYNLVTTYEIVKPNIRKLLR